MGRADDDVARVGLGTGLQEIGAVEGGRGLHRCGGQQRWREVSQRRKTVEIDTVWEAASRQTQNERHSKHFVEHGVVVQQSPAMLTGRSPRFTVLATISARGW